MLALTPLVIAIAGALAMYQFSAWQAARSFEARARPLRDARLMPVLARLQRALDLPALHVQVLDEEQVNGLAAPDGRIYLTRGLLARHAAGAITSEEIASVVAHELGHVALGHTRRRMIDVTGANALRVVLLMTLGRLIPGLALVLSGLAARLLTARLSRQDEYEADAYAAALLTKAGLGTAPQRSLLAKLDRMAGSAAGQPAWLLSHPPSAERIAAIEALEARWAALA